MRTRLRGEAGYGALALSVMARRPERVRQRAEQLGLGIGGGESEADAARGLCDAGGDLQQAQPKRGELRLGEVARFGTAEWLYDGLYCARGQAENLTKLHA